MIVPKSDPIGVRLLGTMGWRQGHRIGPRLTHEQLQRKTAPKKPKQSKPAKKKKVYGMELPPELAAQQSSSSSSSSSMNDDNKADDDTTEAENDDDSNAIPE